MRVIHAQNFVADRAAIGVKCFWWDNDSDYELMDRENAEWYDYATPIIEAIKKGYEGDKVTVDYKIHERKNEYSDYTYTTIDDSGTIVASNDKSGLVPTDFIDITGCNYFDIAIDHGDGYRVNCIALYDNDGKCLSVIKGNNTTSLWVETNGATKAKYYINNPWGYRSPQQYEQDLKKDVLSIKVQAF